MNKESVLQVCRLGTQPVVGFAAEELARYLNKMTGKRAVCAFTKSFSAEHHALYVGGIEDFADQHVTVPCASSNSVDTAVLRSIGRALMLSGSNPRSVLFAVYRYLELIGARWLWPGDEGELLPHIDAVKTEGFELTETASLEHRGVCVEGAASLEHNLEFVDWMAKRRLNEYHLHFDTLYVNYNHYYSQHHGPGVLPTEKVTLEESYRLDAEVAKAIKRRGLIFERGGHNWTCGALGLEGFGREADARSLSSDMKQMLALVDGKRELFRGSPNNTQLCYSNPKAFDLLVDHVVGYALDHPEVDILHFWLADNDGNLCECSSCQKMTPSDWYVRLVNAISGRLSASGSETKVAFLSYLSSRWPPTQEEIDNRHGNLIFMFAPYPACFLHALTDDRCTESYPLERPERNRETHPRSNQVYLEFLEAWQSCFEGDSFLFYYYLWFGEVVTSDLESIISRDVGRLKDLGLNGVLSAQPLPVFWPTGSAMSVLAETAWNDKVEMASIRSDYLNAAFGEDAGFVLDYLDRLRCCLAPKNSYSHDDEPQNLGEIETSLELVERALPHLEAMGVRRRHDPGAKAVSFLVHHNRYTAFLLKALIQYSRGNTKQVVELVTRAADYLTEAESELFWALDLDITRHRLETFKRKYGALKK